MYRVDHAIVKNASMEYYYCITSNELDHNIIDNKYYNIVRTVCIGKYIYVTIIGRHVGFVSFTNYSCCKITSG